ncbi:MAG: ATP-binding protein [Candidatus Freyarchaeota archaeon]
MSELDDQARLFFTDFDGSFRARLSRVEPVRSVSDERLGTSAPYTCTILVEYERELLRLLDVGMLLAVKNFRSSPQGEERYTLMELSRFWPQHFGLMGVREHQYFPMQFEVIEQTVQDWETSDKSTMAIHITAIPINYDLVVMGESAEYVRCFSYPILGERVYVLNEEMIKNMYNRNIEEKFQGRKGGQVGTLKMFEFTGRDIPIYVDYDSLVRYHFGIFAFTGGGKSNLLATIIRKIMNYTQDTKVMVFDISCEYPFLLMDVLADRNIPSLVVLERKVSTPEEFNMSIVKPKKYEHNPKVLKGLRRIMSLGRVTHLVRRSIEAITFSDMIQTLEGLEKSNTDKPNYVNAIKEIRMFTDSYMTAKGYTEEDEIDDEYVDKLNGHVEYFKETYGIYERSSLYGWISSLKTIYTRIKKRMGEEELAGGYSPKALVKELLESDTRLICLSVSDPETIKQLTITMIRAALSRRKREFSVKPYILFVWDEAQEFAPAPGKASGVEKACSEEVERLLRQGRKYGLGGCLATQRIAHLNTSALQQLHTYFVGTLPRPYDRGLISNTFMVDREILERTLEFTSGEWLLSSYIATGMTNVPIFLKSEDTEEQLDRFMENL